MFEGWRGSSSALSAGRRYGAPFVVLLGLLSAGCGTVGLSVEQPVGARVELYESGKWLGICGPDWGTGWNRVFLKTVEAAEPCEMELDASSGILESAITWFPRRYRVRFDLSRVRPYPGTPTSMVEVRYVKEVVPPKYQHILHMWQQDRILEVLTHVPIDVLANVLYHLGDVFKEQILDGVDPEAQRQAAVKLKAMLEAPKDPSPMEVESWLKSFLPAEQLAKLCFYVRNGVSWRDVRWVSLVGKPKPKNLPFFWRAILGVVDVFLRQPEIWDQHVDFYRLMVRRLMVKKVEAKLVNVGALKFYGEVFTYRTSGYSDRVIPAIDLVQDVGLAEIIRPNAEQEDQLQRYGMTRSLPAPPKDRREAIRRGLPPVSLKTTRVTAFRSQIIGALLEGELAVLIIWNNPLTTDPERYLTTLVTVDPHGLGRVWILHRDRVLSRRPMGFGATPAESPRDYTANAVPVAMSRLLPSIATKSCSGMAGAIVSWVRTEVHGFLQSSPGPIAGHVGVVGPPKPLATIVFGRRPLEPWKSMPREPVSRTTPMQELEPAEEGALE